MPVPNVIPKVLLPDAAMNRFADQLMAVLNPILRNVNGDLTGPVAAPTVIGWLGKPLDASMASPALNQVPKWNGSAWVPGTAGTSGAVTAVTATGPLASSGGTTPNISLTGVVPVANGGTGLSTLGALGTYLYSNGTSAVWQALPALVSSVTATGPLTSSGGTTPDIALSVGANGTFLSSNGSSAVWAVPTATTTGAGIGGYRATTTTPDTVSLTDYVVDVNTTGNFTVNLPTAGAGAGQAVSGRVFIIKNSGGATVTVAPAGAQLIDGAASFTIVTKYASFTFISTGSGWALL